MEDRKESLKSEEYLEAECLLDMRPKSRQISFIPQKRIMEKMDEYMSRRDHAGAERHLLYWLEEAVLGGDEGGELMVRNELIGHYRKMNEREKALGQIDAALRLLEKLGMADTVSGGTTYTNSATALNAFGENARSLELFEKARAVYEKNEGTDPRLLGGLYNNMGLTCTALKRFDEAYGLFRKADEKMRTAENGEAERAVTCLNIAMMIEAQYGMEEGEKKICELLDEAYDLLKSPSLPRDGYYAFVLEKCAPAFSYYGYFLAAEEMKKEAEAIYEGN